MHVLIIVKEHSVILVLLALPKGIQLRANTDEEFMDGINVNVSPSAQPFVIVTVAFFIVLFSKSVISNDDNNIIEPLFSV